MLHTDLATSPATISAATRKWAEENLPARHYLSYPQLAREPGKKLRVGFVSGDFNLHPVAYFLNALLISLNYHQFDTFAYAQLLAPDFVTEQFKSVFCAWRDITAMDDVATAELINQDQIDILIDLSGITSGNRLGVFALKPAPIQITWLGYFNTTGLKQMDYILSDSIVLPLQDEHLYTETPLRLPNCYLCYMPPYPKAPRCTLLPYMRNGYVTFGSFNKIIKLNDSVIDCWAEIMTRVPDSRLILTVKITHDEAAMKTLLAKFAARGIQEDRIKLLGRGSHGELLSRYLYVDIALDPFPYSGGTTTAEALMMSVPVLTWPQQSFASRVSASFVHHVGHPEWVADSREDYIQKAVSLANTPQMLEQIHHTLYKELPLSPFGNTKLFARGFESALRQAWTKYCHEAD